MDCLKKRTREVDCTVVLLDEKEIKFSIKNSAKGSELLEKVFQYLNLAETDYFGLRYKDAENHAHWVDSTKTLSRQMKSISSPTFYFGVKFYLEDPCQLREEVTRYQFFLQLKQDILQGRVPCDHYTVVELAGLIVQSELGDFDPHQHSAEYISEFRFVPIQNESLEKEVARFHKTLQGLNPSSAEFQFLEKIRGLEMYGVDLHQVSGQDNVPYYLGLSPLGITVFRNKTSIAQYIWPRISRVNFEGTKFVLAVQRKSGEDNEYSFQLPSKSACKHLWKCCVEQHAFFRLPQVDTSQNRHGFASSSFRHSGRTQREALQRSSSLTRPQPEVERSPSKRFSHRLSSRGDVYSHPGKSGISGDDVIVRTVTSPMSGRDSPTSGYSTKSLPWENEDDVRGGLYSPTDDAIVRHSSRRKYTRSVTSSPGATRRRYLSDWSGDESESGFARRYRRHHSATDYSDTSGDELSRHQRRRRKKSSRIMGDTIGSEGERRTSNRARRRSRRRDVVDSGNQWYTIQQGMSPSHARINEGDIIIRKLPSNAPNGMVVPEAVQQVIQRGLVDSSGLSENQLKDIIYTEITPNTDRVAYRVSSTSSKRNHHRSREERRSYRNSYQSEDDNVSMLSGRESVFTTRSEHTPNRYSRGQMKSPHIRKSTPYYPDVEGRIGGSRHQRKELPVKKESHYHENGYVKNLFPANVSPETYYLNQNGGLFSQGCSMQTPLVRTASQGKRDESQLSHEGLLAMQELKEELVKLGQPTVQRYATSKQQSPWKNERRSHPTSNNHVMNGGSTFQGSGVKVVANGEIPVEYLSQKRMSITTQEILRVSNSEGEHQEISTEL